MSAYLDNALIGTMHTLTLARQGHNLGAEQAGAKRRLLFRHRASKPFTMEFVTLVYFLPLYHPIMRPT